MVTLEALYPMRRKAAASHFCAALIAPFCAAPNPNRAAQLIIQVQN